MTFTEAFCCQVRSILTLLEYISEIKSLDEKSLLNGSDYQLIMSSCDLRFIFKRKYFMILIILSI